MKTFKKVWSFALAGVMALSLCLLSTNLPTQAGDGSESTPADAVVTKTLQIADGITTPTVNFTFTFTKVSFNSSSTDATKATMPDLGTTNSGTETIGFTPSNSQTNEKITLVSGDVVANKNWPAAGLYTYTVTETVGDETAKAVENGTMSYSRAVYTLEVVVATASNGSLYVSKTACTKTTGDNGNTITNPTKGDPGYNGSTGKSDLEYVNTYTKEGGIEDSKAALTIKKLVTGTYGDTSKEFEFALSVTFPSTAADGAEYTGTVYNASGVATGTTYTLKVGTTESISSFKLAHNQTLVFENLPAGTTYILSETGNTDYTPSYSVVQNSGTSPATGNSTKGQGLSTPSAAGSLMLIGEKTNTADFTNENENAPETGILMNNLPYILLIAAAMLGLVAFVAAKRRREMH